MAHIIYPYEPDQHHLFPASPRDRIPEGHLASFVSDKVDELNLGSYYANYGKRATGRGSLAYDPRMLSKVLIYSYCVGVFSSRKIAAGIDDLVAPRFLAAGNPPGHRTIARFRRENSARFAEIFQQVVKVAQGADLVEMGALAVDGSRVKAKAGKHKAMSYGRMKPEERRLKREIDAIINRANDIDDAEDEQFGPDFRGNELPAELQNRETRKARIRAAIKELEEGEAEADAESGRGQGRSAKLERPNGTPPDSAQYNFTDPESRNMRAATVGYEQCFNTRVAVDAKQQVHRRCRRDAVRSGSAARIRPVIGASADYPRA